MAVTEGGNTSGVSLDDYLAVLGDKRRHAVVGILAEEDRSVQLSPLAGWVAAETQGVPLDALAEHDIEQMKVELHHNHLPKLDAVGIVDYCYEEGRITPSDEIESVERLVDSVHTL